MATPKRSKDEDSDLDESFASTEPEEDAVEYFSDEEVEEDEEDEEADGEIEEDFLDEEEDGDECYMKPLKTGKSKIYLDGEDDSIQYANIQEQRIPDEERMTDPTLTIYEQTRILGTRAKMLSLGAIPFVKNVSGLTPPQIAYVEMEAKLIPFIIRRPLPGKRYELWNFAELEYIHKINDPFFVPNKFILE